MRKKRAERKIFELPGISTRGHEGVTGLPICVGFGISTPEQVAALAPFVDGVVVGSAFEQLIETHLDDPQCVKKLREKVQELKRATK